MKFISALGKTLKENSPTVFIILILIIIPFYYGYITVEGIDASKASFWEITLKVGFIMLIGYFMCNSVFKIITEIANDYKNNLRCDKNNK